MPLKSLPPKADAAEPAAPEPAPPLAAEEAAPAGDAATTDDAAATFRVGAYEVGDGSCSELCGHPDILY